jgi:uncharacterized protein YfiM (DUF2279 family)
MDSVLQLGALLVALGGAAGPHGSPAVVAGAVAIDDMVPTAIVVAPMAAPVSAAFARDLRPLLHLQPPADSWTGEDKFRHVAASWTAMVFTYAVTRVASDDSDTAIAVALPVTAAFGIAKEIADHRGGGPFSFRDLAADALGAGAAWLFLREMR